MSDAGVEARDAGLIVGHPGWCVLVLLGLIVGCPTGTLPPSSSDMEPPFNIGLSDPPAIDEEPLFVEQAIFDRIPDKIGSHAATITAFEDGELLAAWYSYSGPHELTGSAIYMARRAPDADNWSEPWLHIDRPQGDGNPVLYSEGDRVWLFQAVVPLGWSTAHIEVQTSEDRGQTWSAASAIAGPLGSNVRYPPVRLAGGELLLPAYDDLVQRALFFASSDGDQWTQRSALASSIPNNAIQPAISINAAGGLLAVMRNTQGGWLWVTASHDDGRSWLTPSDSGFPNPGSAAQLLSLGSGRMLLVCNDDEQQRRKLSVALSADDGRTWTAPRMIADDERGVSYPSAAQAPDGVIHVVYSLGRERIQHVALNEAWVVGG